MFKLAVRLVVATALLIGAQLGIGENPQFHYGSARAAGWIPLGAPPTPDVSLDFANGYYVTDQQSVTSLLSNSNSSGGFCTTAAGTLVQIAPNTLRICSGTGLLIEESRTNIVTASQSTTGWTTAGSGTLAGNATTAPDGTVTANSYTEDAATSLHRLTMPGPTLSASTTYATSVYVKYAGRQWVRLSWTSGTTMAGSIWVDILNCTLGGNSFSLGTYVSSSVSPAANGFCRIVGVATTAAASGATSAQLASANANNDSSSTVGLNGLAFYAWGAQVEAGSFATSYIPTTTVPVSRSLDSVSINSSLLNTIIGAQGTFLFEMSGANSNAFTANQLIFLRTNANTAFLANNSTTAVRSTMNAIALVNNLGSGAITSPFRAVIGWSPSGRSVSSNASSITTDSQGPLTSTSAVLGSSGSGSAVNGYITRISVYTNRLLDAALPSASTLGSTPPTGYALDLDFTTGTYKGNTAVTASSLLSVTNSGGYCKDPNPATGYLQSFSSNTLRICNGLGLLVEEARTNLSLQSQTFDNVNWTKNFITVTADQVTAPDGTLTADLMSETGASAGIIYNPGWTVVSGSTYTASVYLKRNNCDWIRFGASSGTGESNGVRAWFNIATGAVGSTATFGSGWTVSGLTAQSLPNGWVRVSFLVAPNGTNLTISLRTAAADGNVTSCNVGGGAGIGSAFYAWGTQNELGSSPTSYVATTTASVTRNADAVTLAGVAQTAMNCASKSILLRWTTPAQTVNTTAGFLRGDIDTSAIRGSSTNGLRSIVGADTVNANYGSGSLLTSGATAVLAADANGRSLAVNNGAVGTSAVALGANTAWNVGQAAGGGFANSYFSRVQIWTQRLADAAVAQLTAPDQVYADFASNTCQVNNANVDCNALAVNTNSTGGYVTNSDGSMSLIGANTLRIGKGVGLLSENTITNLLVRSEAFDLWAGQSQIKAAGYATTITAPDQSKVAQKLTEDTATNAHATFQNVTKTASAQYTFCVYTSAAQRRLQLAMGDGAGTNQVQAIFDVTGGRIGVAAQSGGTYSSASATITPAWGTFWRACLTGTSDATTSMQVKIGLDANTGTAAQNTFYTGDNTSGVFIWGAQLEAGANPTSYFPTAAASAARSNDNVVTAGQLDAVLKSPQGSVYARTLPTPFYTNSPMILSGGGSGYYLRAAGSSSVTSRLNGTAIPSATMGSSLTFNAPAKSAIGWDSAVGLSLVSDGGTVGGAANVLTMPSGSIGIGFQAGTTTNSLNGYISNVTAYGYRLPDAVLQQMTQPDPVPAVSLDFTSAAGCSVMTGYGPAATPCTGLVSNTNSSGGYATNADGSLTNFGPNTLRYGLGTGLLAESAATNLILQSQTLQTTWTLDNGSITTDAVNAPDGTLTADLYNEDATNTNAHGLRQNVSLAATTTYTHSVYLKYAGRQWVLLGQNGASIAVGNAWVDVLNCVAGSQSYSTGTFVSSLATPLANGYCRFSVTFTTASAGTTSTLIRSATANGSTAAYAGLNGPAWYAWGAQVEANSWASSYIPTTTVPSSRSSDNPVLAGAALAGVQAANFSATMRIAGQPQSSSYPMAGASASANVLFRSATFNSLIAGSSGGTSLSASTSSQAVASRFGYAQDASGRSLVGNVGTLVSDSLTMSGVTAMGVGGRSSANNMVNTYIPRLEIYNFRLPDATLTQKTLPTIN